ncbi:leucine-rich repeat domain-containing protein [Glaciecola sp. MH2013]|uniref:Calx-beta domain-containing protein n=1 Tax=Glaciecola sp. MH2013 TaxID=2785524 RepID=UPI00189C835B|nr:Calx-beta domain-containing protein [Glaciecola sp. MH2013]MBF7074177.1 leucine-rich repeat domain-containing protein [Glaciecola sp. MH2013]
MVNRTVLVIATLSNDFTAAGTGHFVGRSTARTAYQHRNSDKSIVLTANPNEIAILTLGEHTIQDRIQSNTAVYHVSASKLTGEIAIVSATRNVNAAATETDVVIPPRQTAPRSDFTPQSGKYLLRTPAISSKDTAQIDVLFVYTAEAASQYDGNLPTYINYLMTLANEAFANSDVHIQLNGVGMVEVNYASNEDANASLIDITTAGHEAFAEIANIRTETGADIVSLITADTSCGVAFGNDQILGNARHMFHVVSTRAILANSCAEDTFAHELGHNLGLGHSHPQEPTGGYTYNFALGHGFDNAFATIMAYPGVFNANFSKVLQFSNSEGNCNGYACGIERTDAAQGADASFALNQVRFEAATLVESEGSLRLAEDALNEIEDSQLKQCVSQTISTKNLRYAASMFELVCDQGGVESLAGLENFTQLEVLELANNNIRSLLPLASLSSLSVLNVSNNAISDITPLSRLLHLNRLNLSLNAITEVTALETSARLRDLDISENSLTDISTLISQQRRWVNVNLLGNTGIYCWQQNYFERYLLSGFALIVSEACDPSPGAEDADGDGISNDLELTANTNPLMAENAPGNIQFSHTVTRIREGEAQANIVIERVAGNTGSLQVSITSDAISAQQNVDYILPDATLVFADGETSKMLSVNIVDDSQFELAEKFTLSLYSDPQTRIDSATVVIDDNEAAIEWLVTDYAVTEQQRQVVLVATRTADAIGQSTVAFSVSPETALFGNGNDYLDERGTLTFAEGETEASVIIGIFQDSLAEPEESFYVTLTAPENANLGQNRVVRVSITDGEPGTPDPVEPNPSPAPVPTPNAGDSGGSISVFWLLGLLGLLIIRANGCKSS